MSSILVCLNHRRNMPIAQARDPVHRVYLRTTDGQVTATTTTTVEAVARFAHELLQKSHAGQPLAAAWTCDGLQRAYVDLENPSHDE